MIAKLWADQIIAENKTYAQVPSKLKKAVADELRAKGREDLIIE